MKAAAWFRLDTLPSPYELAVSLSWLPAQGYVKASGNRYALTRAAATLPEFFAPASPAAHWERISRALEPLPDENAPPPAQLMSAAVRAIEDYERGTHEV